MKLCKRFICAVLIAVFLFSTPAYAHDWATSYLYGGTSTQYENYLDTSSGVLNNVCPDYFELNADGSLKIQKVDTDFIASTHQRGISVTPFITNHFDRELGNKAMNNSEALTTQIAEAVYKYQLDGVDIDIENVNHEYREQYTNFVRLLREKMPDKRITVAVAANPYNWTTGWQGCYDYTALAGYCDYLMIMAYDESYNGSAPGPVASAEFVEKSIQYALSKTTADKIVLGIPFYGRYWQRDSSIGGYGITAMDVENLLENYTAEKRYLEAYQTAFVTVVVTDKDVMPRLWGGRILSSGTYDIYYDDLTALQYKLDLVEKYQLRGSGSWAMGQEDTRLWPVYQTYKTTVTNDPIIEFVSRLYRLVLGREPDASGLASWSAALRNHQISGVEAAHGFYFSQEFQNKNLNDSDFIELLYKALLDRASDAEGKENWLKNAVTGVSRKFLFAGFGNSTEFNQLCSSYGIVRGTYYSDEARDINIKTTEFVSNLYNNCLGRSPDVSGLNAWTGALLQRGQSAREVAYGFYFSQEFAGSSAETFVTALYRGMMGREPDEGGRVSWMNALKAGTSKEKVFEGFVYSVEFTQLCQYYGVRRGD